jgi:hypothetical protein
MLAGAPAIADDSTFAAPQVDYSADMIRDTAGATGAIKVFRTHDKSRTEVLARGHAMISIVDRAKKEAVNLDPERHVYTKMDLTQLGVADDPMSTNAYTRTLQGVEFVAGIETKKYSYVGTSSGTEMKGIVWLTSDNIPVRNIATVTISGQTISVASHLENLKVEKLDPNLFEVPAGYVLRETLAPARGR